MEVRPFCRGDCTRCISQCVGADIQLTSGADFRLTLPTCVGPKQ